MIRSQFRRVSPDMASSWTLRDVFRNIFVKRRELAKSTRSGYEATLNRWELITGNPAISELADPYFDLDAFADFVRGKIPQTRLDGKAGSLTPAAANKEIRQLQSMLAMCGPKMKGNRDGQGFLPEVVLLNQYEEPEPMPRFITLDELGAIYDACHVAEWPRKAYSGVAPALWWRSAVVYLSNCGTRPIDWLSMRIDSIDLTAGVVQLEREQKTGKANKLPLAACVVEHLREIWGEREFVWPAPANKTYRNATWKAIQIAAGISDTYRIKDLRSTCGDRFYEMGPAGPEAAQRVLNHSNLRTTQRHYTRKAEHDFRTIARLADEVEQPAAFLRGRPRLRIIG